jgi:8-hydroxy-5-deazaflavin:NADPH oxidoreductase
VTIAVVGGTGPEGSGLALRWALAGEKVVIGSRNAERAQQAATEIRKRTGKEVSGGENPAILSGVEIVVVTIPFSAHAETLRQLKPALQPGQILVDTTVPLAASVGGRATRTLGVWQGSAAEQAAELVPPGVPVVAAMHNLSAELLNQEGPVDCDVLVCSDDQAAGQRVRQLATKIPGVRALDGGRLEMARIVEQITALLIALNIRHKGHSGLRITGLPPAAYQV